MLCDGRRARYPAGGDEGAHPWFRSGDSIGVAALAFVAGCSAGGGGGAGGGDQIVVPLDTSIPDLAAATIVAERDCRARGREAYLLAPPSGAGAAAPAGARRAVFACRLIARQQFGGNQAAGAR